MSTEKMREDFEAKFPVPFGVEWRDGAYHISKPDKKQITPAGHLFYLGRWESWQASRAAIEVELRDAYMKGWEASGEGWNHEYPGMTHETESWQRQRDQDLGLKVKL